MEKSKELLNCPFCGSKGEVTGISNAHCSNFDCRMWNVYFVDADWNRRSPKPTNEHKDICSSAAPITNVPCHVCGAKSEANDIPWPEKHADIPEPFKADYTRGVIEGSNSMHDQFTAVLRKRGLL